jgi:hypothetical protein
LNTFFPAFFLYLSLFLQLSFLNTSDRHLKTMKMNDMKKKPNCFSLIVRAWFRTYTNTNRILFNSYITLASCKSYGPQFSYLWNWINNNRLGKFNYITHINTLHSAYCNNFYYYNVLKANIIMISFLAVRPVTCSFFTCKGRMLGTLFFVEIKFDCFQFSVAQCP